MKINPNLYPKDGFWFKERDGVKISAGTWAGVVTRLAAYRTRAGYPPGNPREEVMRAACERNPGYCSEDSPAYNVALKIASLKGRVLKWFGDLRSLRKRTPINLVDDHAAQRRLNICRTCPMNQEIQESCSSCRTVVKEMRAEILKGDKPVGGPLIQHACAVLGEDLPTSIYLDSVTVENAELPAHCWRKRTL